MQEADRFDNTYISNMHFDVRDGFQSAKDASENEAVGKWCEGMRAYT